VCGWRCRAIERENALSAELFFEPDERARWNAHLATIRERQIAEARARARRSMGLPE
jgi:hypothetical protein